MAAACQSLLQKAPAHPSALYLSKAILPASVWLPIQLIAQGCDGEDTKGHFSQGPERKKQILQGGWSETGQSLDEHIVLQATL